jgi:calmodulin
MESKEPEVIIKNRLWRSFVDWYHLLRNEKHIVHSKGREMAGAFDQDQLADLKEAFVSVDADANGLLSVEELGQALRVMGQNPTAQELTAIAGGMGPAATFTFDKFLEVASQNAKSADTEEDVIRAFRVFDKGGSGTVSNSEFRKAMSAYGERLDDDEIDEILREADLAGNGYIEYTTFVRNIYKSFKKP